MTKISLLVKPSQKYPIALPARGCLNKPSSTQLKTRPSNAAQYAYNHAANAQKSQRAAASKNNGLNPLKR
jgi:hypothetical protein